MAQWIVFGMAIYAALGMAYALWYIVRGVDGKDQAATGAGWGFRLLILPGAAALWPVLLARKGSAK